MEFGLARLGGIFIIGKHYTYLQILNNNNNNKTYAFCYIFISE